MTLDGLERAGLALLGREWMLHGHLQDRVAMALVLEVADRETMQDVAIEEWMAASPVYSRRMQRAMRFVGTGVETIFKNLQLDIGAPHQFLDFRFRLDDADHGEFWLAHCGALMDVEPMGEQFVHGMCHTIEDPTFDATAGATNPLAQVRPIHRPPRVPADRVPHCAWRVDVVAGGSDVQPTELEGVVSLSAAAQLPLPSYDGAGPGWHDYSGPFDPDFCLEDLSLSGLRVVLDELALQSHLLLRSLLLAVERRFGAERRAEWMPRIVRGWCGLTSQRIRDAFALPETLEGARTLLALHPMLHPFAYTGFRLDGDRVVLGPVLDDDGSTWLGSPEVLEPVLQAAFPSARLSEDLVLSVGSAPAQLPPELFIAQISTG
ncbi:MAG: hypothetical protein ABR549_10845, partial [Mycobacteriales bacterium]